ncbi:MAG: hypothetical protein COU06_01965 [Candidatus Harrisonbacteria bacterium CG10_big_fil_rev_8_21_14_0_10_38_8]|uniref:PLD phosphodiesterase domain-containing protein n=1 Tax=Candidatus Harrisonbacteria bacterium CG10_big_fil_rev_8_21_14_0_10_38_8 TaxID=1974582 RepID=A0A2M6WJU0_9BACT|nr:MAG: hypothetical protein COU06_01965 [Candidatus Harrisonbacteria bacterium CG10_big_fil_rev_8_21_14_0_10_38_8]
MAHSWKFYTRTDKAWRALLVSIKKAEHSIDFEKYIFTDDLIGRKFINLFLEKAKKGVQVRLLLDSHGSQHFYRSPVVHSLEDAGVEIVFFNRIFPRWVYKYSWWFLRDHRKIVIIDEEIGFIGGIGVREDTGSDRDTYLEIVGPVVDRLKRSFDRMWLRASQKKRLFRIFKPKNNSTFDVLNNAPYPKERYIYQRLIGKIKGAKKYIYLTTPYFVPSRRLFKYLRQASKRGVDVRILIPQNSDHPFVDRASHSYFGRLLRNEIKIFRYKEFIHAKTAVVDGCWGMVGSSNLDNLSLLFNYEANIESKNKKFIKELENHFKKDLKKAAELHLEVWMNRSSRDKLKESVARLFRKFL